MKAGKRLMLLAVLVAHLFLSLAYSVVVPLGEAPDELSHYDYFRYLLVERRLPQGTQVDEAIQPPGYYLLAAFPAWCLALDLDFAFVKSNPDFSFAHPADPPNLLIHTAAEAFPYRGSALGMHLARAISAVLSTLTVWVVYRLTRQLFPDQPALALGTAGGLAFVPEFLFLSGAITNDNLAALLGAALTTVLVVLLSRSDPVSGKAWVGLGVLLGLAWLTKASLLLFGPLAAGVWASLMYRIRRSLPFRRIVFSAVAVALPALAIACWWYLRNWQLYGDPLGWNLIIAGVPRREGPLTLADWGFLARGLFESTWGRLGGAAHLRLPLEIYLVLALISAVAAMGWIVSLRRAWRIQEWSNWAGLLLLALVWGMVIISWARFSMVARGTDQARLWYPAIGSQAVFFFLGLAAWVPRPHRPVLALVTVAGSFAMGLGGLKYLIDVYAPPQPVTLLPENVHRADVSFDGQLRLVGFVPPSEAVPGAPLPLLLYWRAERPLDQDYRVSLQMVNEAGELVWEWKRSPLAGRFSTDRWPVGPIYADIYQEPLPFPLKPGEYELRVRVQPFGAEGWLPMIQEIWTADGQWQPVARSGEQSFFTLAKLRCGPPVEKARWHPLGINLGENQVELSGYSLSPDPAQAGRILWVSLLWTARQPLMNDYTVFVHLVDETGQIRAQHDSQPQYGSSPTSTWWSGDVVEDIHGLLLPADLTPDNYNLLVGLYDPVTRERLAVPGEADRAIRLGTVVVLSQ